MTNKLNTKFEDFGSIPNPEVWEGIEASLDTRRRKKRLFWIFLPGSAAVLIALFLVMLPSSPGKSSAPAKIQAQENEKSPEKEKDGIYAAPANKDPEIDFPVSTSVSKKRSARTVNSLKFSASTLSDSQTASSAFSLPGIVSNENGTNEGPFVSKSNDPENDLSLAADSLPENPVALLDSANDSSLSEITRVKTDNVEAPDPRVSAWAFSLQAGGWDAANNRNQLISSTTVPVSEALTDVGSSSFVPPLTSSNSVTDTDTISVLKPLSLRANVTFTGKKGFVYTGGLNFDQMDAFYNEKRTRFMSAGINLGFGKGFALSPRISLTPLVTLNYDRFILEKNGAPPLTPSAYQAASFRGNQFSFQLDLQAAFHLNSKHSLYLAPAVKYYAYQSLTTVNGPILRRDWWNGLHLGWKYNF
ncbi:MAG: hypothetical protein K0R65_2470 [Crocinitomicaceae bacterium]|jgi:hypothetical protein|nr:hypothetical protein [Crocinitomicaceae bacterium]